MASRFTIAIDHAYHVRDDELGVTMASVSSMRVATALMVVLNNAAADGELVSVVRQLYDLPDRSREWMKLVVFAELEPPAPRRAGTIKVRLRNLGRAKPDLDDTPED